MKTIALVTFVTFVGCGGVSTEAPTKDAGQPHKVVDVGEDASVSVADDGGVDVEAVADEGPGVDASGAEVHSGDIAAYKQPGQDPANGTFGIAVGNVCSGTMSLVAVFDGGSGWNITGTWRCAATLYATEAGVYMGAVSGYQDGANDDVTLTLSGEGGGSVAAHLDFAGSEPTSIDGTIVRADGTFAFAAFAH